MTRRPALLMVSALLLFLPAGLALAQTTIPSAPDQIYRLTPRSGFEEGCFDPCLCFAHFSDALIGTWRMTPGALDPRFSVYDITDVNWFLPGLDLRVTGKGTYRIGGEFARMHQLALDLVVGDRPVQHFDSGLVLGGAEFPEINLTISINNMVCHDTVFHVSASPVPLKEIVPYALQGSSYNEGCYGPCDCAIVSRPLLGRFGLLTLRATDTGIDYAVLNIRWAVRDANTPTVSGVSSVNGFGVYLTRAATAVDPARGTQRMVLDLIEGGKGPTRFDSGVVPAGAPGDGRFPLRVDIDVAENGFACYDNVYSIHAKRRVATVTPGAVNPEPKPIDIKPAP